MQNKLELELKQLILNVHTTQKLAQLAYEEAQQSKVMEVAERKRLNNGASDFFRLNIREETAANAQIKYLKATLTHHLALFDYYASTLNLDKLYL